MSDQRAEMNIVDINWELRLELEESKRQFRDLKEKFLISEATAYSLANQLSKYECGKCTVIESVLGEKLQSVDGEPAEKLTLAEKLRESHILIQQQARKLSQLRQKLHQGRAVSFLLSQHLWDLLTHENPDNDYRQGLQEHLAEGYRLAECLVHKLGTENHDDEENGKEQELLPPRLSREAQEETINKTWQYSRDEDQKTSSSQRDLSDAHQPLCTTAVLLDKLEISPSLDIAKTEDGQKQEEEEEPVVPSREQQEKEKMNEELQDSLDEEYLAPSSCHESPDSHQPPDSAASLGEKHVICCALDVAENKNVCKDGKGQEAKAPRKYHVLIQNQARELTQLRQQLREGREASLSLSQHLRDVLTQDGPDSYQGQHRRHRLAEGRRLAERLVRKLSAGNNENEEEDEEKEPFTEMNDQGREFCFVIQVQAKELAQLRQKLWEGMEASFFLWQHLNDLLTPEGPKSHKGQDLREQLAEGHKLAQGHKLAERLAHRLSPENLEDEDDEEEEEESSESLAPSELGEEKLDELLPDSWGEQYFHSSGHPDLSDSLELLRIRALLLDEAKASSTLDGDTPIQACAQARWYEDSSPHLSEAQVSCAQLESSVQGSPSLGRQLDPQLDRGDGKARLSLFSTAWSSAANVGSGDQRLLFRDLKSDASFGRKNPPMLQCDTLEGPADNTCGFQVHDLIGAASVLRQKVIRRKLLFSKWRIACRFPGL